MQDTPAPHTPPPAQPPADDGVFKVQHGSAADQEPSNAIPPAPPVLPGQTVQPDQPAPAQPADVALPPLVDQTQPVAPSGGPDMSKIPQSLIYLATEASLPPAPPEPEAPPQPPSQPLPPAQ